MKIPRWGFVTVILGAVLIQSTSSYAVSENDAKVMKCYNKIDKMGKSLDKRETSNNTDKRKWGEKARISWVKAKEAAEQALTYGFNVLKAAKIVAKIPEKYGSVYGFAKKFMNDDGITNGEHNLSLRIEEWAL